MQAEFSVLEDLLDKQGNKMVSVLLREGPINVGFLMSADECEEFAKMLVKKAGDARSRIVVPEAN